MTSFHLLKHLVCIRIQIHFCLIHKLRSLTTTAYCFAKDRHFFLRNDKTQCEALYSKSLIHYQLLEENKAEDWLFWKIQRPASFQDTLHSDSCLPMTQSGWHLYYTPIRAAQQGSHWAEGGPQDSVHQSDLSSKDTVIRFGRSGRKPGFLSNRSRLKFRCK